MVELNLELVLFILGIAFMVLLVSLLDLLDILEELLEAAEAAIILLIFMLICWLFHGQYEIEWYFFVSILIFFLGFWLALHVLKLIVTDIYEQERSRKDDEQYYHRVGNRK